VTRKASPGRGELDDAEFDPARFHGLRDGLGSPFMEGELDLRVLAPEGRDGGGQQARAHGRNRADREPAAFERDLVAHGAAGRRGLRQQGFRMGAQGLAGGRERRLAAAAVEEPGAQLASSRRICSLRAACARSRRAAARVKLPLAGRFDGSIPAGKGPSLFPTLIAGN
jgi:hypothetical protein